VISARNNDSGPNGNEGAAYVYTISAGAWTMQQKLTASNAAANDALGTSVAISGNTVVLGADARDYGTNNAQGGAYTFTRTGSTWTQTQELRAPDGRSQENFGVSVAISGPDVIVGAYNAMVGTNFFQGAAFTFRTLTPNWRLTSRRVAGDPQADAYFGASAAISGDTAVIGSSETIGSNNDQGAVYVFVWNGTTWTQQQKLIAADGQTADLFGSRSVAVYGDTIAVSVTGYGGGLPDQGAVYIFERSAGVWTLETKLVAQDPASNRIFGKHLDLDGDTLIIAASNAAYIFTRTGGGPWSQQQKLTEASNIEFGADVSISGNTAVVGAQFENSVRGTAYVYTRSGNLWSLQQKIAATDAANGDNFGVSVKIDGDTIVAGAYAADPGGVNAAGAAYVFTRSGSVWTQQQKLVSANPISVGQFGGSVALDGETIVVGERNATVNGNATQGAAYVFSRSGSVWSFQQRLIAADGAAADQFSQAIGISGDKILVTAPSSSINASSGRALAPEAADQGGAYFYTNAIDPTAADVSVSGRVVNANGRPIANVIVTLTDSRGSSRLAQTGQLGLYGFDNVPAGETYILSVAAKRYSFANPARIVSLNDSLTDADFIALE
jgi:hypothetical protein